MCFIHIDFSSYCNAVSMHIFLVHIKQDNMFCKVPNKNLEMQLSLQCLKLRYFARFLPCYSKTVKPHTCVAALGKRRHRRWESAKRYQQDKKTQKCKLVNEPKLYWSWYIYIPREHIITDFKSLHIILEINTLRRT